MPARAVLQIHILIRFFYKMRKKTVETMVRFKVYRQKLYWKKTLNIEAMKERLAGKDTTDQ